MLYAGLDLSRKRLDFHLLDGEGETVDVGTAPPDADGLLGLTGRLNRHREPIRAAIESMNGARFVHDRLELAGWQVETADAVKAKGLAPLACKTDRIDAWVLAELARRKPATDRRARPPDRRVRTRLTTTRRRAPLRAAPGHCARHRLGARLHNRSGDRRHQPLRDTDEANRLHRPLPTRLPIRTIRPARRTRQERAPLPALGADRSDHARQPPPALPRPLPTHQTTARQTTRRQSRPNRPRPPPRRSDLSHPGFDGDFDARVRLAEGEVCHAESEEVSGRVVGPCDAVGVRVGPSDCARRC